MLQRNVGLEMLVYNLLSILAGSSSSSSSMLVS